MNTIYHILKYRNLKNTRGMSVTDVLIFVSIFSIILAAVMNVINVASQGQKGLDQKIASLNLVNDMTTTLTNSLACGQTITGTGAFVYNATESPTVLSGIANIKNDTGNIMFSTYADVANPKKTYQGGLLKIKSISIYKYAPTATPASSSDPKFYTGNAKMKIEFEKAVKTPGAQVFVKEISLAVTLTNGGADDKKIATCVAVGLGGGLGGGGGSGNWQQATDVQGPYAGNTHAIYYDSSDNAWPGKVAIGTQNAQRMLTVVSYDDNWFNTFFCGENESDCLAMNPNSGSADYGPMVTVADNGSANQRSQLVLSSLYDQPVVIGTDWSGQPPYGYWSFWEKMRITTNGVLIGGSSANPTPQSRLSVLKDDGDTMATPNPSDHYADDISIKTYSNSTSPGYLGYRARGTGSAPSAVAADDVLLSWWPNGYSSGSGWVNASSIYAMAENNWTTSGTENSYLIFRTSRNGTDAEKVRINSQGNVGIGVSNPTYQLHLSSDSAAKPGTSTWIIASDERLKDIQGSFNRGLEALSGLNTVYFSYKEKNELGLPTDKKYVGIIAQDVQKVIPEAVSKDDQGFLHVTNDPIIWTAVNAIKELSLKVRELVNQIGQFTEKLLKKADLVFVQTEVEKLKNEIKIRDEKILNIENENKMIKERLLQLEVKTRN